MGIETHRTTIGGYTYSLTTFGAKQGQRVFLRLIKILGPAAAEIAMNEDNISEALQMALGGATETDLDFITEAFTANCAVILNMTTAAGPRDSAPVPLQGMYDTHFAGRYFDLGSWLLWCIERNYADFFGDKGIGGLVKRASLVASPSDSQKV